MYKYYVWDYSSNRYIGLPGVSIDHSKELDKNGEVYIKIPMFGYYSPAFCGYDISMFSRSGRS